MHQIGTYVFNHIFRTTASNGMKLVSYKTRLNTCFMNTSFTLKALKLRKLWIPKVCPVNCHFTEMTDSHGFSHNFWFTTNLSVILSVLESRLNKLSIDILYANIGVKLSE